MNCIIIDDEPNAIDVLKRYAAQSDIELLASFRNPLKALSWLHEHAVDVIFLDVSMPELKGTDFVKAMKPGPLVVFTTAYSEYAVASYELDAVDYLVKPVSFERFLKAVGRVREHLSVKMARQEGYVLLKSGAQLHRVRTEEILFVEKEANYLVFVTADKKILVRANMNEVFDIIPPDKFCQVHKSFVIALNKIDIIEVHQVVMSRHTIPVGSSFREAFMARLGS